MNRFVAVVFALGCSASPAFAEQDDSQGAPSGMPKVDSQAIEVAAGPAATLTAKIFGPQVAWLNQRVELELTVERVIDEVRPPAPQFPEIVVPGAIAIGPVFAPPPEEVSREGVRFLVQRRRYLLFVQKEGELTVPSLQVEWREGAGRRTVASKEVTFRTAVAPGAPAGAYVVADALRLVETVEGGGPYLKVGDAVTRAVTVQAEGVDAMLLPPVLATEKTPAGWKRYSREPDLETHSDRGRLIAERTEKVTYVVQSWGMHRRPELRLTWLEPQTGLWHHETLPGERRFAWPNPRLGLEALGSSQSLIESVLRWLSLGLVISGIVHVFRRFWPQLKGMRHSAEKKVTERKQFAQVLAALRAQQAWPSLNALYRWLPLAQIPNDGLTVNSLKQRVPSVEKLTRGLFDEAQTFDWSGDDVAADLIRAREGQQTKASLRGHELPFLNDERASE